MENKSRIGKIFTHLSRIGSRPKKSRIGKIRSFSKNTVAHSFPFLLFSNQCRGIEGLQGMSSPPWTARICWEEMYLRLKQTSRNDDRMDGHRCHRTLLLSSLELTIAYLISISQLPITDTELAAMFHLDYTHDDDGELADELVLAREEAAKLNISSKLDNILLC